MNDKKLRDHIEGLEKILQSESIRKSSTQLDELLADDFIEFGSSGNTYSKKSIISTLSEEQGIEYIMWDFDLRILSDIIVHVTYKSKTQENGRETFSSLRSSLWRYEEGRWRMFFHQGTPFRIF